MLHIKIIKAWGRYTKKFYALRFNLIFTFFIIFLTVVSLQAKPRLIIMTDIGGGDPDDQQSMVRLMTMANKFDIEGLLASSTLTKKKALTTHPEVIAAIIEAYGEARQNLLVHEQGFPAKELLLSKIKRGLADYHKIGEGYDAEASEWIIKVVDETDPRVINIAVWGGTRELAQALWKVKTTRSVADLRKFISKIRVHAIADQDGHIEGFLKPKFPDLFLVYDTDTHFGRKSAPFRGQYMGGDRSMQLKDWCIENIIKNHGTLGAQYPVNTDQDGMKEGDTPSWFYFLENGLNFAGHPEWGGWGGRYADARSNLWEATVFDVFPESDSTPRSTVFRWRPAFQSDFQARMDWCVTQNYDAANHNPLVKLNGQDSTNVISITASPGDTVHLDADGSTDPDGDLLTYLWSQYREAGSFGEEVKIMNSSWKKAFFVAPKVSTVKTIHIILSVKDDGTPNMYSFRRMVVTVDPDIYKPSGTAPVKIILDTDMGADVDDVGALAVAHALADRGEIEILAVVVSSGSDCAAGAIDAVNTYYGRPDIPIGSYKGGKAGGNGKYAETIALDFPSDVKTRDQVPDEVTVYRKTLAAQPDKSVVIVTVGFLNNLETLLRSEPDEFSPKNGYDLVKQKVRHWVCMGGRFPSCGDMRPEPNFRVRAESTYYLLKNWPALITFSGGEIGKKIKTGAALENTPDSNPVKKAYLIFKGSFKSHSSWDQTAVLFAARGLKDYWGIITTGFCYLRKDGWNEWREKPDKKQAYLIEKMDPKKLAFIIESLMIRPPKGKNLEK